MFSVIIQFLCIDFCFQFPLFICLFNYLPDLESLLSTARPWYRERLLRSLASPVLMSSMHGTNFLHFFLLECALDCSQST